jgi:hypothetical protein
MGGVLVCVERVERNYIYIYIYATVTRASRSTVCESAAVERASVHPLVSHRTVRPVVVE